MVVLCRWHWNVAKLTQPGGNVTVIVEAKEQLRQATARVRDTGPGISPEMLPRIFEPFMQTDTSLDRSRGGLDLGLALVRGIGEKHGGTAGVESEGSGKGAEDTGRFPLKTGLPLATVPARGVRQNGFRRHLLGIVEKVLTKCAAHGAADCDFAGGR